MNHRALKIITVPPPPKSNKVTRKDISTSVSEGSLQNSTVFGKYMQRNKN